MKFQITPLLQAANPQQLGSCCSLNSAGVGERRPRACPALPRPQQVPRFANTTVPTRYPLQSLHSRCVGQMQLCGRQCFPPCKYWPFETNCSASPGTTSGHGPLAVAGCSHYCCIRGVSGGCADDLPRDGRCPCQGQPRLHAAVELPARCVTARCCVRGQCRSHCRSSLLPSLDWPGRQSAKLGDHCTLR